MRANLFSFGILIVLLGCQTTAPPLRVGDGKSVTLELVELANKGNVYGFVSVMQDDYDCYGFAEGTKTADMPKTKTYAVTGRRFLTIGTEYFSTKQGSVGMCSARYTFPIIPGSRYQIAVANNENSCTTAVYEIQGQTRIPIKIEQRGRIHSPFSDGNGPWCQADDRFRGSSSYITPR